jgi:two-component system, LuxR family, sensor kinase FixL
MSDQRPNANREVLCLPREAGHACAGQHGEPRVEAAQAALADVDNAELRKAQQRARNLERLTVAAQMTACLAHESRSALQRLQCCVEMLRAQVQGMPAALKLVAGIQKAKDDLQHINQTRGAGFTPQDCNLEDILQEAWSNIAYLREGGDACLRDVARGTAPRAKVDRLAMEFVFRAILQNALDACRDPAEIAVAWSQVDLKSHPAVRVALRDNGPGLTAEQRQKIFEPFYTTQAHGTGLGMTLAKRVVEVQGGELAVGAGSVQGTEILITLPRSPT